MISTICTLMFLKAPPFPGEFCTSKDKDFSRYRYKEQIPVCKRNVSTKRKNVICKRDGVDDRSEFKVDHIIPLSMGGNNSDRNLWCQHMSLDTSAIEGFAYRRLENNKFTHNEAVEFVKGYKFKSVNYYNKQKNN